MNPAEKLEGGIKMRLCKHLKEKFNIEESFDAEMSQSNGHPWNGWLSVYESNRLVRCDFITGGYSEVIKHIAFDNCQEYTKEQKERARELLNIIEEEWERITSL